MDARIAPPFMEATERERFSNTKQIQHSRVIWGLEPFVLCCNRCESTGVCRRGFVSRILTHTRHLSYDEPESDCSSLAVVPLSSFFPLSLLPLSVASLSSASFYERRRRRLPVPCSRGFLRLSAQLRPPRCISWPLESIELTQPHKGLGANARFTFFAALRNDR